MDTPRRVRPARPQDGFSIVELLVVVGIIGIMVAVAIPSIARYIRNYRIRAAGNEVAAALQQARLKAITSNVNYGVLFVPLSATTYRVVREDVAGAPVAGARPSLQNLLTPPLVNEQAGQLFELPQQVTFTVVPALCPLLAGAARPFVPSPAVALRFNRLGASCEPSGAVEPCPDVDDGQALFWRRAVNNDVAMCVIEERSGLTRAVLISPGGRVQVIQSQTEAD